MGAGQQEIHKINQQWKSLAFWLLHPLGFGLRQDPSPIEALAFQSGNDLALTSVQEVLNLL